MWNTPLLKSLTFSIKVHQVDCYPKYQSQQEKTEWFVEESGLLWRTWVGITLYITDQAHAESLLKRREKRSFNLLSLGPTSCMQGSPFGGDLRRHDVHVTSL